MGQKGGREGGREGRRPRTIPSLQLSSFERERGLRGSVEERGKQMLEVVSVTLGYSVTIFGIIRLGHSPFSLYLYYIF